MLLAVTLAIGVPAAVIWRHGYHASGGRRQIAFVAALALGVRLAAAGVIHVLARNTPFPGVWLDDEAAFYQATQWLMPDPFDGYLPNGLDHLGGDGYLGLTTVLAFATGAVDPLAFRVLNAGIGTLVVVLAMLVARRRVSARAALLAGIALALWPTLVLWSVSMLRDTLVSVGIVLMWWVLERARELGWPRVACAVLLALVLELSLRPYIGLAMLLGVAASLAWFKLTYVPRTRLAQLGAASAVLAVALLVTQARRIDSAAHELLYRQTVSRVELTGRLYTDFLYPPVVDLGEQEPIRVSATIATVEPDSGWVHGGIIQQVEDPDQVLVAFTDGSLRHVPRVELVSLKTVPITPVQLVATLLPNALSVLDGTSPMGDTGSRAWVAAALAWDAAFAIAMLAVIVRRLSPRLWLFPVCITLASLAALVAVPGAPANGDRHRTNETLPMLVVLASGAAGLLVRQR